MQSYNQLKRALAPLIVVALTLVLVGPNASAQQPPSADVAAASTADAQAALGTSIPYQGQLNDGGNPANGTYDFQFKLYNAASAGNQVGSDVNLADIAVTNGLFSVALDFGGSAFNGEARYLAIGVRPGASTGVYTTLSPRRPLLANPYALYSNATRGLNVDGSGYVGIGTTNPARPLEVITSNSGAANHLISFATTADGGKGSLFGVDTTNHVMYWRLNDSGDYGWQFQDNQGQSRMQLSRLGNIDIQLDSKIGHSPDTDIFPYKSHDMANDALGWFNPGSGSEMWLSGRTGMTFFTNGKARIGVAADGTVGIYGNFGVDGTTTTKDLHVNGNLRTEGTATTKVLQITGGSDLAEPFVVSGMDTIEPGTVVVLDPANPGQLRIADGGYDPLVAGVVSGAGGINPGLIMQQESITVDGAMHPVALTGKVYVKAVGPIKVGDLLTTANVPGHAMAATDRERAFGTVLGKAMSPLAEGTGLVLVLVTLQ